MFCFDGNGACSASFPGACGFERAAEEALGDVLDFDLMSFAKGVDRGVARVIDHWAVPS